MEIYLPDATLAKKHKEGLNATKDNLQPDFAVRHKYLETAYRVKGRMDNNEQNSGAGVQINIIAGGYVPRSYKAATASEGSNLQPGEIQDADLAPQGKENDDSTDGTGTPGDAV